MPTVFRASLSGQFIVKFLIRYDLVPLEGDDTMQANCQFRFQRMILYLNSKNQFRLQPQVHLSMKKPDELIINMQTLQESQTSQYEKPKIKSIEIVKGMDNWILKKKDSTGNFFIINPKRQSNPVETVSDGNEILVFSNDLTADDLSLNLNPSLYQFFNKEVEFNMSKFRLKETVVTEAVDLVVRWELPNVVKQGFYSLLKVELLRLQKHKTV